MTERGTIFNLIMEEATYRCFSEWSNLLENESLLYYYTDVDAFLNGIIVDNPKESEEICLWATRCTHLNDKNELVEGLNKMSTIVKPHVVEKFNENIKSGHTISFSRQRDYLPMWSMYGKNGTGIMLAFDVKVLTRRYYHRLQPCIYSGTEYDDNVSRSLYERNWGEMFVEADPKMQSDVSICMAFQYIMLRKNRAFEYEDECRVIGIGFPFYKCEKSRPTLFRNKNGFIVPYIKEFLPKEALKAVMIGPNLDPELSKDTIKEFLNSRGFDIEVETSQVPYRG